MKVHPRKDGAAHIHGLMLQGENGEELNSHNISSNGKWHERTIQDNEKIIGIYGRFRDYWITSLGFIVYSREY